MSEIADPYCLPLSEGDIIYLKNRIISKTRKVGDCLHWGGEVSSTGYGIFRFSFSKKRFKVKVHRFLYFISNSLVSHFDRSLQVSHACHHKTCVNLGHLSLEDAGVNNQRSICVNTQRCIGHGAAKPCLL
jgi:hypothetical protein